MVEFCTAAYTAETPEERLKPFGHDLKKMWKDGRLEAMRAHVQNERRFPSRLDTLSDFHSRVSKYTTRYPNPTPTLEAEIDPLEHVCANQIQDSHGVLFVIPSV